MKYLIFFTAFLFIQIPSKAQIDTTNFYSFKIIIEENLLIVENASGKLLFKKQFHRPYEYLADLDADQSDELIIVDSIFTAGRLNFTIYLFNGDENIKLIDSIYSGSFFPFVNYSEEIESMIIVTGNHDFDRFNLSSDSSTLPINLWQVENDELIMVNDELYEPFLSENTNLVQLLDFYAHEKRLDCSTSQLYKGIVASAFANYINAGEQSLAAQMLKKYYLCEDIELFKQEIIDLIFPKAKE